MKGTELTDKLQTAFTAAVNEDMIFTDKLVEAAQLLPLVYECIFGNGIICGILKKDIMNTSSKVHNAYKLKPERRGSINTFINDELLEFGYDHIKKTDSGIKNLLWMTRAMSFIVTFLDYVVFRDDFYEKPATECARAAYEKVLKPYHGFVVSKIASTAMGLCPDRKQLCILLGFDTLDEAKSHFEIFLTICKPIVDKIFELLEASNCNFNEKA